MKIKTRSDRFSVFTKFIFTGWQFKYFIDFIYSLSSNKRTCIWTKEFTSFIYIFFSSNFRV